MKNYKIYFILVTLALLGGCSTPAKKQEEAQIFPSPETYLIGKNVELVAKVYGQPKKYNTVGTTNFISYSKVGTIGYGFSNICFLEIQAKTSDGVIASASLGSNLYIDSKRFPINVRQECNKLFYQSQLVEQ